MRTIYELLWCLNLSRLVVWVGDESGTSALLGMLYRIVFPFLSFFKPGIELRRDHTLIIWAMTSLLAIAIFPFLRLLTNFSSVGQFIFPALGIAAVGALPVGFWLRGGSGVVHNAWGSLSLLIETIAAFVCISFYISQVREWPRFLGLILLILHFGIWGTVCHFLTGFDDVFQSSGVVVTFFWWAPLNLVIPILGFLSCATLARYCRMALQERGAEGINAPS